MSDNVTVGKRFTCEGVKVIDFFTMANVDGSGRRIHMYIHTCGILVIAGCFRGTLEEFCEEARKEGKNKYASVVKAAAEAMLAEGGTGGWDEVR